MFNVKKVENYGPNGPVDGIEGAPVKPSRVTGSYERNPRSQTHALVDECLTVRGDLDSDGDVLVKGKVIGNVRCKVIIIDVDASVEGSIEAEEVIVRGKSKGMVRARRVCLEKTASVESEIYHQSFSAEEGARIMGTLTFTENPLSAAPAQTQAQVAAPVAPARANGSSRSVSLPAPADLGMPE
jgi:cytoskeletal protein CcmA (bactofilin family)